MTTQSHITSEPGEDFTLEQALTTNPKVKVEYEAFRETCQRYFKEDDKDNIVRAFVFFTAAKGKGLPVDADDIKWTKEELEIDYSLYLQEVVGFFR